MFTFENLFVWTTEDIAVSWLQWFQAFNEKMITEFENKMPPTNGAEINFEEGLMGNELICALLG